MIGRTTNPTLAAGNRMLAIGTPVARPFLEPQKTMTISSALLNPSMRAAVTVATRTTVSSTTQMASSTPSSRALTCRHSPPTTAALKAP